MAIIKCKMCGGDLNVTEGVTVAECEYCGTKQTVPNVDNEKKLILFSRANRLRLACEFDKAAGVYENIVAEFPEEAEAYWGLVLCRYGIEYVDDPATGKKVPTCHRSSFDSILEDSDFEQACENADALARRVYREEAKAIEDIRKGILEVSGKEPPYDIFICYKETDESGERTVDSVVAQDVYDALTEKGYRVFFSRITLEDKLGTEYEPYIFAALNSAKIMLVFGTDYEYFNAVWVKNEWSRYLKLMAQDKSKHLIPCYKDVDAYDMPKEFQKLQGQDMGKVGAVQDLLRGIDKLLGKGTAAQVAAPAQATGGPTVESLLKRGQMFLEDRNWKSADEYFDKVLDINPECAEAYLGKFFVFYRLMSLAGMENKIYPLDSSKEFQRAEQFADAELAKELQKVKESNELKYQQFRLWDVLKKHCKKKENEERAREEEARRREEEARRQEESRKARVRLKPIREKLRTAAPWLASGLSLVVGLNTDGTAKIAGSYNWGRGKDKGEKVGNWKHIVAVAAGTNHVVGLRADGTVVVDFYGDYGNDKGQWKVSEWTDIAAIAAVDNLTVGLKSDGSVVTAGTLGNDKSVDVSDWRDIAAVTAYAFSLIGLRKDGTVISGHPYDAVSALENIVDIAREYGLRDDGTVISMRDRKTVSLFGWTDIVAIAAGTYHVVGLKADGTVVATMEDNQWSHSEGQTRVSEWTDIVAIAAGYTHTVGLRADGTVVFAGKRGSLSRVEEWKLFDSADTAIEHKQEREEQMRRAIEEEHQAAEKKAEEMREEQRRREEEKKQNRERIQRIDALTKERSTLWAEYNKLGLFGNRQRKKEIKVRCDEICLELEALEKERKEAFKKEQHGK